MSSSGWPRSSRHVVSPKCGIGSLTLYLILTTGASLWASWSVARQVEGDFGSRGCHCPASSVSPAVRLKGEEQTVEMVWTGPHGEEVPYRHTEQAILQVLNSARSRLLLVSYAVYAIPNIREALVRAARRGVQITVVVETPDRIEGQGTYSTLRALGEEVAACSTVYFWPREMRGGTEPHRQTARQMRGRRRSMAVPVVGEPDGVRLHDQHGAWVACHRRTAAGPGGGSFRQDDRVRYFGQGRGVIRSVDGGKIGQVDAKGNRASPQLLDSGSFVILV